jgi:hypothetical protein
MGRGRRFEDGGEARDNAESNLKHFTYSGRYIVDINHRVTRAKRQSRHSKGSLLTCDRLILFHRNNDITGEDQVRSKMNSPCTH